MTRVTEVVEPSWLGVKMCPRRAGGFGLQGAMHALVSAVMVRWVSASARLSAGESKAGSAAGLDKHLYIIWNVSRIPGWKLV
jgi:hypothetical protein